MFVITHSWAVSNDYQGGEGLGKDVFGNLRKAFEEEVCE